MKILNGLFGSNTSNEILNVDQRQQLKKLYNEEYFRNVVKLTKEKAQNDALDHYS